MNKSVTLKIKKTKINQTEQGQIIRDEFHFDSSSKTAAEQSKQQVMPERFQVWSIFSIRNALDRHHHNLFCEAKVASKQPCVLLLVNK